MLKNQNQQHKIEKLIENNHSRAIIRSTPQFAKDLSVLLLSTKHLYDFSELRFMIELIANGKLPYGKRSKKYHKSYDKHPLRKISGGQIDVHIESDWLLLYSIPNKNPFTVRLNRTGTHQMLFEWH